MQILIVGPGAMGCLFAARLKRAGGEVVLLDYLQDRAAKINAQGIIVEGITGEYRVEVPVVVGGLPEVPDTALICVKSNNTGAACRTIKPWLKPETMVVTLQNGVGNLEMMEEVFGGKRVLGGVTAEGATLLGPGRIRHAGQGDTIIGPGGAADSPAEKIVAAFQRADFNARSAENVHELIWGKLIINVGINALTAITRLKNGRLGEMDSTRKIMAKAVNEAVTVAKEKGIHLPYPEPLDRVLEVCRATSGNIASMLQDVLKERLTEVDFINGAIVREGKARGIPTPVNSTLTYLVKAIQESYQERVHSF
ncbi:ketopantoate reductase family protein [Thermodesulfobacteriota bacterium]